VGHHWYDLTPWAGQLATIGFTLHWAEEAPAGWPYLDEVTVGSLCSGLWVREHAPAAGAVPGEIVALQIGYGNRRSAVASSRLITGVLPDELSFVSASPPPVATTPPLVWDAGDRPIKGGPYSTMVTTTPASTATT
jgi:hypothetical protein